MIQQWLGLGEALGFAGDTMVLLALSTFVYGYGRWPFLTGLVDELRERMPGMMTLVTFAGYFKSSLASVYGQQAVEEEVSGYYIAGEIAKTHEGLMIALPPRRWSAAEKMPLKKVVDLLRQVAGNADLDRYQKHPREPKKPPPQRTKNRDKPHVSTAKLLAQRKTAS